KVGMQTLEGFNRQAGAINQDISYLFLNRTPFRVTQYATPLVKQERARSISFYGQDQWTVNRLTLNLGVRFVYFKGWVPDQTVPAGTYVPVRNYAAVDDIPNFKDVTPRIGGAYDLFGNGKTAIKAAFGMYVGSQGIGLTEQLNPALSVVTQTNRSWNDA